MLKNLLCALLFLSSSYGAAAPTREDMCQEICLVWSTLPPLDTTIEKLNIDLGAFCSIFSSVFEEVDDDDLTLFHQAAQNPLNQFVLKPTELPAGLIEALIAVAQKTYDSPNFELPEDEVFKIMYKAQEHFKQYINFDEDSYNEMIYKHFLVALLEHFKQQNPGCYEKFYAIQQIIKDKIPAIQRRIMDLIQEQMSSTQVHESASSSLAQAPHTPDDVAPHHSNFESADFVFSSEDEWSFPDDDLGALHGDETHL